MPNPTTTLQLTACLILVCTANFAYYKSASDSNTRSSFMLPNLDTGTVITAIIDLQGAGFSYKVELWQPQTSPPNSPFQTASLSGTAKYASNPLSIPGSWRIVVTPSSLSDPQFLFTINIFANNQTIGRFIDVARYYRFFTIFHTAAGTHNVTLTVPSDMATEVSLSVYGPFQSLTAAGGNQLTSSSQTPTTVLTYTTAARQYYYIQVVQSAKLTLSGNSINVKYDTDMYQCPYDNDFTDYNGGFAGCSNTLPTYGFPCINYDTTIGTCLSCANMWSLSLNGVCMQDTTCPSGQYFSLGSCYNAILNCNNF
jgi:hypothetical protein